MLKKDNLKQFSCELIFPEDTKYDASRQVFYGGIDKHPVLIVKAKSDSDVIESIKLAVENNLELAIKSGGHSFAGYSSSEGGIVLDLRQFNKIDINEKDKTVWVGTGVTAGELTTELDKYNLAIGFGDTGSVGIGGITLGGGVGYLVRKFGLAIDNLIAAKIVTAKGEVLEIDSENDSDLFWAIRGGGGNFGVVTNFKFKLHTLSDVYGGMLLLPAESSVLYEFIKLAENAPEDLSGIVNVMPTFPMPFVPKEFHGKLSMMALMLYAGDPKEGEKVLAPFRALAKPIADQLKAMRYKEMYPPEDPTYHPLAVSETMFVSNFDMSPASMIIEGLNSIDAPMRAVQLRVLGGAFSRVPVEATAFAHRKEKMMANVAAFYTTEEEKLERQQWVKNISQKLKQDNNAVYVNFLGPDDSDRIKDAYPKEIFDKLVKVKNTYDPENLFRLNYNIKAW